MTNGSWQHLVRVLLAQACPELVCVAVLKRLAEEIGLLCIEGMLRVKRPSPSNLLLTPATQRNNEG